MAHFGMNGNSSSIFKQFGNLRHTKKPGQYDEEYVEEGFSSMQASQDVDELILHKMIFHSVIVCSAFEEIMVRYDKLARQKEGTETSQERSIDKLTDFGAAEQLDHEEEQFISLYGTEEYLHPDMYDRAVLQTPDPRQLTSKVDIWRSMGVTSFHVAAGQFPFKPCGGRRNRQKIETKEESLVRQEMASELQTITCIEVYEPFSTGSGERFIAQHTDSKGVKCKDRFSNDLNRTDLKWYFGADNIPWHICVNLLEVLATTAKLDFGISPLCLSIKCLSSYFQDLKIFTFVKTRLRGTKFVNDLLNTEGSGKTGIGCCGQDILQDIPVIDVKDVRGMEEEYMESPTKRVNADMTGYSKVDKEEAQLDGKIETENVNNVVPGRMFGVMLHWIMNTHYKQGYTWIFVMLVLLSNIVSTLEKPVREGTERTVFHTFQLLKSKVCQNPEENIECPGDNFRFKLKLEFCGYTCASSEEITCMNSAYGMMFFCIPKSTSCSKGIGWQVEGVDGNGLVVIKETNCPEGFYQAEPSKCHNACRTKHESLGIIPEGFIVFKQGDHISPTILMCDSKAGYFSAYNNSFVNYDENFLLHMDFCTHINQSNPCSSGQIPLHNGTCVEPCRPGYERDKTDFFCKQVIDESSTLVPSISGISPSKHITTATQPSTTAQQHGAGVNIGLVIGLIVGAVVIIIIIVCFTVWCVRRRRNRKMRGNNSRNSRTGNGETIQCRKNYDGCEFTKVSTTGDIHFHIGEGTESGMRLMKKLSTDTGLSLPGNENESDEESACTVSLESGYDTVQRGQPIPGQDRQTMMVQEMKSLSIGSSRDENCEETQVLKRVTD